METKEYLGQISRMDKVIENKLSEIYQLKTLSYGVSAIKNEERVQSSSNFDRIGNIIVKIEQKEIELDNYIDEYIAKKQEIIKQIDSMENEVYYQLLFSRYVQKKKFERIAEDMSYSSRQILRLHGKALQEFEKKYGKTYKKW